jgi:hypothetical protein
MFLRIPQSRAAASPLLLVPGMTHLRRKFLNSPAPCQLSLGTVDFPCSRVSNAQSLKVPEALLRKEFAVNLVLRDSTAFLIVVLFSFASITSGCKSTSPAPSETAQTAPQDTSQSPPAQQMSVDDLVAPIALYPDQLLAQVLTTAVNPQEILDLGNWLLQNQSLQGDAMTNAAKKAGFSPSAQYLALFPQVVDNMCQQMDWTRQLGQAFSSDQKGVMDAVQRKRVQAQQVGNLASTPQMTVATKKADNGQPYVEIQPADPKVVYVPQYNPVTIYNTQAAPAPAPAAAPAQTTTTTTTEKSGVSTGTAIAIGLLSFGVGMAVGSAISNNNNYYPYPAWGYHSVYVVNRPYYPPPYRPPVYPGYRPAYGYNPSPNYHWNQYNRNVNVNVNNNYYNRFNNTNVNTRPGYGNNPSTLPANNRPGYGNNPSTLPANNRPGQNNQSNWKGQSTYQGARPATTQGQKPGASMANAVPRNEQYGQRPNNQMAANRPDANNPGASNLGANRGSAPNPNASNLGANRPNNPNPNTSNLANNRANNGTAAAAGTNRANSANAGTMNRGGDRGYAAPSPSTRPAPSTPPASRPSPPPNPGQQNRAGAGGSGGGGAFGGGNAGSARSERAASDRGRSSMGSGHGGAARRGR